jgi:dihydroorotase
MIRIIDAQTITGEKKEMVIDSNSNEIISGTGLTIFPGLIDPHVHFRVPGMSEKEDWQHAARAALSGGYTTVFDMPNTLPPTITSELLQEKIKMIDQELLDAHIPLRYKLYFGADKNHFDQIPKIKNDVVGIKVFMGCSTGNLVIDDDESLETIFQIASENNLLVAVHAEDETELKKRKLLFQSSKNYADHSHIRNVDVAVLAVEKAIHLAKKYRTKLYILHVSTKEEVALIQAAKAEGLSVFAETTPHHLFLSDHMYAKLHGKAVVNPPLRNESHHEALWQAIHDGVIDTIGSDHAPHKISEKEMPYGQCPSGMPGIETTLPLLLNAYHQGHLSLEKIISLTHDNPRKIFNLPENDDRVLVDLQKSMTVNNSELKTKCAWSAFHGVTLRGWPVYTIAQNHFFDLQKI